MAMKKVVLFLMLLASISVNAQTTKPTSNVKGTKYEQKVDSLLSQIYTLIMINNQLLEHIDIDLSLKNRYKLYPTDNLYTLRELDSQIGRIKQVQWSLDSDSESTFTINNDDLSYGMGYGSDSFELYPTKNMYQFILIDKTEAESGMFNGVLVVINLVGLEEYTNEDLS